MVGVGQAWVKRLEILLVGGARQDSRRLFMQPIEYPTGVDQPVVDQGLRVARPEGLGHPGSVLRRA